MAPEIPDVDGLVCCPATCLSVLLALSSVTLGRMTASTPTPDHPRSRSMESWRGRKAVLASRGEVDGPRVAECEAALSFWRRRTFLIRDTSMSAERADELLDLIDQRGEPSEPVEAAETDAAAVAQ